MESRALEVQRLATPACALLSGAKAAEVLGGPWGGVGVKLHHDSPDTGAADGDIEEHLRVSAGSRHFCCKYKASYFSEMSETKRRNNRASSTTRLGMIIQSTHESNFSPRRRVQKGPNLQN